MEPDYEILLRTVRYYRTVRQSTHEAVQAAFPVGTPVRVNGVEAVVHRHHPYGPDEISVRYENNNVWTKPVEQLIAVPPTDT